MIENKDLRVLKMLSEARDKAELNRKLHALEMNYERNRIDEKTKYCVSAIKKILSIKR